MNPTDFTQWLGRIYATAETEIDCEQIQAILSAYVDAEIAGHSSEGRFQQVKIHLAQCPDCAEEYAGLRHVADLEVRSEVPGVEESLEQFEDIPSLEPA